MAFTQQMRSMSSRTTLSYCLDWIIIVVFLGIAGAFSFLEPVKRDFSLTDKTISFPYHKDTISVPVLFIVAIVVPAAIIAVACALVVRLEARPGPEPSQGTIWKRKLWELHAAWLGLALSLTLSLFLTQTMKNMFGKHRPDFLTRCNPDIPAMDKYVVGGFTSEILEGTSQLVKWEICINKDGGGFGKGEFLDGFRSFPSGHCTVAFAGLTYLSFFLAAKFSATIPFLAPISHDSITPTKALDQRETAAAPPLHLLVAILIPFGAAIYIASTRFTDYKHAGFDVLFGSLEGIISAWFAFRYYHLPIRRGAGWAWAPRRRSAAFGIATGIGSYGMSIYSKGKGAQGNDIQQGGVRARQGTGIELQNWEASETGEGSCASQRAFV